MTKKPKNELKPVQIKRKYRAIQYSCLASEFLCVLAPYITIGIINFDEYFVKTGAESWKVTTGGMLALAVMGVAIWSLGHETTKRNRTQNLVLFGLGWLMFAVIGALLASIIEDVSMIMFCGAIGIFAAAGLDIVSVNYKRKADLYKDSIEKRQVEHSFEKEEKNKKGLF